MKMKLTAIILPLLLISCGKKPSKDSIPSLEAGEVVYGTDDRYEVEEVFNSLMRDSAASTATQIPSKKLRVGSEKISIVNSILKDQKLGRYGEKLCSDEKYAEQTAIGSCSGFLIAPNLILTAGHCLQNQTYCDNYKWVFGYQWNNDLGKINPIEHSNIYSCKRIILQKVERGAGLDYGIVELDRNVVGRKPLTLRKSGIVSSSADLTVIGNPTGLPTKITTNGTIRNNQMPGFFSTTLDTFAGNSGSAVLNSNTGEVEGILVRGDTDYIKEPGRGCMVVNYCEEGLCRGEDVIRVTAVPNLHSIIESYTNASVSGVSPNPEIIIPSDTIASDELINDEGPIFHFEEGIGLDLRDNATTVYTFTVEKDQIINNIKIGLKITHNNMSDLIIYLKSPDGTYAKVLDRKDINGRFLDQIFDNKSGDEYGLSSLVGRYSSGRWQLLIKDMNPGSLGFLDQVVLKID